MLVHLIAAPSVPLPHMEKRIPVIMRPQAIAPLVPPFLDQSHSVRQKDQNGNKHQNGHRKYHLNGSVQLQLDYRLPNLYVRRSSPSCSSPVPLL